MYPTSSQQDNLFNTLESDGWGVGSNAVKNFEEKYAKFHDAKYAISTSSGTTALWVSLKAAGVKAGDEVILPPYTFIATGSSILMANAIPVFVDVDPETFNMDPLKIEAAITEKTKVIMPVHIAGNPCDMDAILQIANTHNIKVIEDAAQAHGAEWDGVKVGALGAAGIFSFQTSKNMSAGEGGIIISNDDDLMAACFSYANCGRVRGGAPRLRWAGHPMSAIRVLIRLGRRSLGGNPHREVPRDGPKGSRPDTGLDGHQQQLLRHMGLYPERHLRRDQGNTRPAVRRHGKGRLHRVPCQGPDRQRLG